MADNIAQWVTASAAVVGAGLAVWKWVFEERIRQRHEMPTIDGDINVTVIESGNESICAYIENVWNNKGTVPIFLDPTKCSIRIYEIAIDERPRAIDPTDHKKGPDKEILNFCPIRQTGMFMLEPNTQSHIQSAIVLNKGPVYEVRSHIEMAPGSKVFWWFRRKVFNSADTSKLAQTKI